MGGVVNRVNNVVREEVLGGGEGGGEEKKKTRWCLTSTATGTRESYIWYASGWAAVASETCKAAQYGLIN